MSEPETTPRPSLHFRGTRARVFQIALGLIAVACFVGAFITAKMLVLSGLLLLGGVMALVILAAGLIKRINAWGAIQRLRERRRHRSRKRTS